MSQHATMARAARLADADLLDLAVTGDLAATAELYHRYFRFAWTTARAADRGEADHSAAIAEAFRRTFDRARTEEIDFAGTLATEIREITGVVRRLPAARRPGTGRTWLRSALGQSFTGAVAAFAA